MQQLAVDQRLANSKINQEDDAKIDDVNKNSTDIDREDKDCNLNSTDEGCLVETK